MEIATQKDDTGWTVYIEGISWQAIMATFNQEFINIYLLVYLTDEDRFTGYDDRMKQVDNKLSFCKENLQVKELMSRLSEMELEEPNDARFGNKKFFVNRLFHDTYVLTFGDREDAQRFILDISSTYLLGVKYSMRAGEPYTTKGVNNDLVGSPNFDRFLDKRSNRWHDIAVKEFEESLKNK
jgi:hypothetical protein